MIVRRVAPSTQFLATVKALTTGASLGVRILDNAGGTTVARSTSGIFELLAGSGIYGKTLTAPPGLGEYSVMWDDGLTTPGHTASDTLIVGSGQGMAITVQAGNTFEATLEGAPSGLATVGVRLMDSTGATVLARTTAGVAEFPGGSGFYQVTLNAPSLAGAYVVVWDTGTITPSTTAAEDVLVTIPVAAPTVSSGMRMPPWLAFCGKEVANAARTMSYLKNGLGKSESWGFLVNERPASMYDLSQLPSILWRTRGVTEVFDDPATDPAPWYDAAHPESRDFLGLLLAPMDVHSTVRRPIAQRSSGLGGAAIGPQTVAEKVVSVDGYMVANSPAGMEWGRRWLSHVLLSACDACQTCILDVKLAAPPEDGSDDTVGAWQMFDAAVTDLDMPVTGNCEVEAISFTITTGNPYLFKPPVNCLPPTPIQPDTFGTTCLPFDEWYCGPGGGPQLCSITPPRIGTVAAIVTIDASDQQVGDVRVGTYASCPPGPTDEPVTSLTVPFLSAGSILVIDSARRVVEYFAADGTVIDGTGFIALPEGKPFPWVEINDCAAAGCIGVEVLHPCGGGDAVTVQIDTQLREV